jgi:hypothetical protein
MIRSQSHSPVQNHRLPKQYRNPNDTLINLHEFYYISNPGRRVCHQLQMNNTNASQPSVGNQRILLVLIHSSRSNLEFRNLIRRTWRSINNIGLWRIRHIFLLGMDESFPDGESFDRDLEIQIESEFNENLDLVQANFVDSYMNLTYKQMMGYKWARKYCSNAEFVVKTDDDVFIDPYQLTEFLTSTSELTNRNEKGIIGSVNWNVAPVRTPGKRWFVSEEDYAPRSYPSYCIGMGYIVTFNLVEDLLKASETVPYFFLEDIYVTGMLREYLMKNIDGAKIKLTNIGEKYIYTDAPDEVYENWMWTVNGQNEEITKIPWYFVHCWGNFIGHFVQLWKIASKLYK